MPYVSMKREATQKAKTMQDSIIKELRENKMVSLYHNGIRVAIINSSDNLVFDISYSMLFNYYIFRVISSNRYVLQIDFTSIKK